MITVPTTTEDNTRRPTLPEGVGFTLIEDHGDTMTVETSEDVTDWAISQGYMIPQSVTMRQGRLALLEAGYLDEINAAIAAIPDPVERKKAEIEWEYGSTIDRNSALVQAISHKVEMDENEMDELFVQARKL